MERKNSNRLLYGSLGVGALGLGAKGLAYNLVQPETEKALQQFNTQEELDKVRGVHLSDDSSFDNSFRVLRDYADSGSKLMNSTVLHLPIKNVVKNLRSLPFLSASAKWKGEGSDLHYDAFKDGPLSGFVRYFDERFEKDQFPQQNISLVERLLGKFNPSGFRAGLRQNVNDFMSTQGYPNFISGTGLSDVPIMPGAKNIPKEEQLQLLERYKDWITQHGSNELKEKVKSEASAVYHSYDRYRNELINPLLALRQNAHVVGNLLLGAGALGAGGYGLYHLWNKLKEKQKKQNETIHTITNPGPQSG